MTQKLLIATRNHKKSKELQEILAGSGIQVLTLDDIAGMPEIVEDGQSFEENATKKAAVIAKLSGYTTLADDSGLEVDALNGAPGIYSARFAGENATDEENNQKLLKLLEDVAEPDRRARFVCVIAICQPDGTVRTVRGTCEGKIIFEPGGQGGFGYDPLFVPEGYSKTFAELSAEEKHRISHRGKALHAARPLLEEMVK